MELAGLPESTNGKDLEDLVVEDFEVAGVKVKKRDNHVIHRLANKKIVIVKLVNRRDAVNLLGNKKVLRELNQHNKNNLTSTKMYANESLYPYYHKLLRKCNRLLKKNQLKSFYRVNCKLKIKYDSDSGEVSAVITNP